MGYNFLSRKIGIFYFEKSWGEEIVNEIRAAIPPEAMEFIRKPKTQCLCEIGLKDGSIIMVTSAYANLRGKALSEAYIQKGTDAETVCVNILPCVKIAPRAAIMVGDTINFINGQTAKEWFENRKNDGHLNPQQNT